MIKVTSEIESTAVLGNGEQNIFTLAFGSGSFSAWGVTRKFFGVLLAGR
jgi:hypothetical protein